jgi:arylsulfatase A-like enzyme
VTIESLRPDHVSAYGYGKPTTPSLDALAGEGTLYENAYATSSWTLPSHVSLFTGLHPTTHRVVT